MSMPMAECGRAEGAGAPTGDNLPLSPPPVTPLPAAVHRYADAARAASTRRAYAGDLRLFRAAGGRIPCTDAELARFLVAHAGVWSGATLARRLAGIAHAHRECGGPDPTRSPLVRDVLRGLRRLHGRPPHRAAPVTLAGLETALAAGDSPAARRDRALLLLGFASGLRRAELVALDVADLRWSGEGVVLLVRAAKGDPLRTGREVAVATRSEGVCPVAALRHWLEAAGITAGPVFRAVGRHGRVGRSRLAPGAVSAILKRHAAALGLAPADLSGHSLRAGFVTAAAAAGIPAQLIQRQTGHRSLAVLHRYIRSADAFAATRALWAAPAAAPAPPPSGAPLSEDEVLALGAAILERRLRRVGAISDPASAQQFLRLRLVGLRDEVFLGLFLDTRHTLLAVEPLFSGTIDHAEVHPRVIVRRALELNAAALICAHNHPSGNAEPSAADRAVTARIKQALALVDVRLLDHLVVAGDRCVSLAGRGWV